jgi:hypothetical protein
MSEVIGAFLRAECGHEGTILRERRGMVRSAAFRRCALSLLKACSIGLRSGEYLGRQRSVAPAASITSVSASIYPHRINAARLHHPRESSDSIQPKYALAIKRSGSEFPARYQWHGADFARLTRPQG